MPKFTTETLRRLPRAIAEQAAQLRAPVVSAAPRAVIPESGVPAALQGDRPQIVVGNLTARHGVGEAISLPLAEMRAPTPAEIQSLVDRLRRASVPYSAGNRSFISREQEDAMDRRERAENDKRQAEVEAYAAILRMLGQGHLVDAATGKTNLLYISLADK